MEVFEKEVSRHPEDWDEVVNKGKIFKEGGKEKNTRDNFPEVCLQLLNRYKISVSGGKTSKRSKRKYLTLI